ncbi:hypothetical protein PC41400_03620 [Paenibacillus chitinolyticus]|uniref:Uncharacterized protein n=1 Tax=Paenibacillus chitinolyticus TaxID=79263 RepID=A0A410WR66_9BACL|nr:hypothetical protein [Paenibacillus chitinolyticus]MCY9591589.1 hypothetical protein [Paenibacillus chitinolyticus]MCY9594578.1 hypothetical protein [Paenibacillus chitinolyticus]QAV16822.1 hypothetical protein PC41400_03620 [Paenibacillus chitinolyticus]
MQKEELDKLFKKSKLPFRYSVKDAEKILTDRYNTIEIDKEIVNDLKKDPLVNYENIIKCYRVNDSKIHSALFNDNERSMHAETRQRNANEPISNSEITESMLLWRNIQEGKFLQLVLESADREYISSFTLQGLSEKMLDELIILMGIPPEEGYIGNPAYESYLNVLHKNELI